MEENINYFKNNFLDYSSTLNDLLQNSEKEFLELGQSLDEYYEDANDLTSISDSILEFFTSQELRDIFGDIEDVLKNLFEIYDKLNSNSHKIINLLEESSAVIKDLPEIFSTLDRNIIELKMLNLQSKISIELLSEKGNNFLVLSENIISIINDISDTLTKNKKNINNLNASIKNIENDVIHLYNKDIKNNESAVEITKKNLDEIDDHIFAGKKIYEGVKQKYSSISTDISKIFSSLQFHDITRQRVEHVIEVFNLLEERMENYYKENAKATKNELNYELNLISNIESNQLEHAGDSLFNAGKDLIKSLDSINNSVEEISKKIAELSGYKDISQKSFLDDIMKDIADGYDMVKGLIAMNSEISEKISGVSEIVNQISGWMQELNSVSQKLKMVAKNIEVKAYQAGEEGESLAVVAEYTQNFSKMFHEKIKGINSEFNDVQNIFQNLQKILQQFEVIKHDDANRMKAITNINNQFKELVDQQEISLSSQIEKFKNIHKNLRKKLESQIEQFDFHIKAKDVFHQIRHEMEEIIDLTEKKLRDVNLGKITEMTHLEDIYTMESERLIHRNIVKEMKKNSEN